MAELGPVSQAILDYIEDHPRYIEIFRMINHVRKATGESHSHKYYRTQLTALALEGRIEAKVQRTGDKIAIRWRRRHEKVIEKIPEREEEVRT